VKLAVNEPCPSAIAVDATNAYWTNLGVKGNETGGIRMVPLTGGTATTLSDTQIGPIGIALDTLNVYFLDFQWSVYKVGKHGGPTTKLTSSPGLTPPYSGKTYVKADDTSVYWTYEVGDTDGRIMRVASSGGAPVALASNQLHPRGLAVDKTHLYWVNMGTGAATYPGSVMKVPLSGGTPEEVAKAPAMSMPGGAAIDANSLFFMDMSNGAMMKVPLAGGIPTSIASGAFTPAVPWIAADTKGLFWNVPGSGNGVKDGAIMTLMANEAAAIVTEQPGPEGVALDAGHVYWANCGGRTTSAGSVMKLVR
jgi:sugar lactone lactonase YvrE